MNVVISESPVDLRIAVTVDGALRRYYALNKGDLNPGVIAVGLVTKVLPGLKSAFVKIGSEQQVFVPFDRGSDSLKAGQTVLVSVYRKAEAGKEPMARLGVTLRGIQAIVLPGNGVRHSKGLRVDGSVREWSDLCEQQGMEVLLRTSSSWSSLQQVAKECAFLKQQVDSWSLEMARSGEPRILSDGLVAYVLDVIARASRSEPARVVCDDSHLAHKLRDYLVACAPQIASQCSFHRGPTMAFDALKITSQIDAFQKPKVWLKSRGFLLFHDANGITTIDVNSGKSSQRLKNRLTLNLEAAAESARQIQLRDIGGLIVMDFLDLSSDGDRAQVERCFRAGMADDSSKWRMEPLNGLGVGVMSREKTGGPAAVRCPKCKGSGSLIAVDEQARAMARTLWQQSKTSSAGSFLLEVSKPIRRHLDQHPDMLTWAAHLKLTWSLGHDTWQVTPDD